MSSESAAPHEPPELLAPAGVGIHGPHSSQPHEPPELLAPAGDWDCAKAAVANGADAIYFGLDCGFNARARASNFALDQLHALVAFVHRYGVKAYATLNTLAFSDELEDVETLIRTIARAGVDAVLVQDLGLLELIRETAPDLAIHASTQMTLTSAECIRLVEESGVERIVLARELSIEEIGTIHARTQMPLEAFVHGALCVAYSGQCLTSESLGGRSANRGQCAQACRLPYELVCDGRDVDLGEQKYLLSPQDLAAFALIPDLIAAGVISLKIEGRLKSPEYVANITRHYREAIDSAIAGRPVDFTPRDIEEMELSFSRGFSPGWLGGCDHKMLVPALSSSKRGVLIGTVLETDAERRCVRIALSGRLKAGDGIVFDGDRAAGTEQGGRVFTISQDRRRIDGEIDRGEVEIDFPAESVDVARLFPGQKIWKTDDPALTRKLRQSFAGDIEGRDRLVDLKVVARTGESVRLRATVAGLPEIECTTEHTLEAARKHPLTDAVLTEQLGRLGGTGFRLGTLSAEIVGAPMIPLSVLGQLRRALVEKLAAARDSQLNGSQRIAPIAVLPALRQRVARSQPGAVDPALTVLCRSLTQLQALLEIGQTRIIADFQDIREYRAAVEAAHAAGARIRLATPRIQKPDEMGIFRALAKHGADGFLVRNLAGIGFCRERNIPFTCDFSLNAANELTVDWLRRQGATRVTPSYDLNRDQLLSLVRYAPAELLEVVIHQHMPMFHMEHCVFCAVLSPGTNKTNCGRPCDVHDVKLRDRVGTLHPLKADVGCRNTLFNHTPQSGAELVPELLDHGVRNYRVELLDAAAPDIARTIGLYRDLLAGKVSGREIWTGLKAMNRVGVTRGTLEHSRDPLAIL